MTIPGENEQDPLVAFETAAVAIEALLPQALAQLGALAREQVSIPDHERLLAASETIVRVASQITDAKAQIRTGEGTTAPDLDSVCQVEGLPSKECEDEGFEFNYEELVGIVARWAGRRVGFTLADLREHLLKNEAVSEAAITGAKARHLLYEMQLDIIDYYKVRGENTTWLDHHDVADVLGLPQKPAHYILSFIKPSKPANVSVAPEISVIPTAVSSDRPADSLVELERKIGDSDIALVLEFVTTAGGAVAAKESYQALSHQLGFTINDTRAVFEAAVAEGKLFKKGISGRKGFAIDPETAPDLGDETDEAFNIEYIEQYVQHYEEVANYVMDRLVALQWISKNIPVGHLWDDATLSDTLTFQEFKAHIRGLEEDGIVTIIKDARINTRTPGRNKKVNGTVVVLASSEVRNKIKADRNQVTLELRNKILERLIK